METKFEAVLFRTNEKGIPQRARPEPGETVEQILTDKDAFWASMIRAYPEMEESRAKAEKRVSMFVRGKGQYFILVEYHGWVSEYHTFDVEYPNWLVFELLKIIHVVMPKNEHSITPNFAGKNIEAMKRVKRVLREALNKKSSDSLFALLAPILGVRFSGEYGDVQHVEFTRGLLE